jgi:formylglycine-generating enzyme required for sulfatase activity
MKRLSLLSCLAVSLAACQSDRPLVDDAWDVAIASISDTGQSPHYDGLRLEEQPDLVPLGRDPGSGLWEFAHSRSGAVPARARDGQLLVGAQTGLVFVLIPGGSFFQGAQSEDPSAPGFDAGASEWEAPVRQVLLEPFFLSKFELTAAQWNRIRNEAPPSEGGDLPALRMSWFEGTEVLAELRLELPTSAQWEYAARASRRSPWWTGDTAASLAGAENLLDESRREERPMTFRDTPIEEFAPWNDGYPFHAPVGSLRPNPFGLYDVHGNAFEWCRDTPEAGIRALRGGGSFVLPRFARVSIEWSREPEFRGGHLGLRPAREIVGDKEREGSGR